MRRVSPPCSDIEDFDDADDGLLPSRGANSPHSAKTTERDTHGHTDTFLVSSASTSRGFLHPALEAAELRLKTPPVHLAGMPPVKPRVTANDDPEAPPARPSSSRRARLLPTPIATPFTSPAVDHRVRQRPERTRTPSPTQQLHTLRGRSEVYPRVLAAAAAMRRPRSVDVASDRSPRVAIAEVAATPTPTVRKMTPSAAVPAARVSKRNPNRYRPRDLPIADDPTVPPGIAGLQQTPEAQRRGARPLPSFDVCMCLSPENGERVNAAMLTPVHPARGAHPRPVPAFNGTDPTLESLLPAEVLHFAQRRVSRRKVFSRWRVRFLAHRLAAHMRNRRLRSVLVRWNGAAAQVRVAREQCQWHVAKRCVCAWSQRLEARRELHRADALSLQFLKRRALRTWNGALRQRGDLSGGGPRGGPVPCHHRVPLVAAEGLRGGPDAQASSNHLLPSVARDDRVSPSLRRSEHGVRPPLRGVAPCYPAGELARRPRHRRDGGTTARCLAAALLRSLARSQRGGTPARRVITTQPIAARPATTARSVAHVVRQVHAQAHRAPEGAADEARRVKKILVSVLYVDVAVAREEMRPCCETTVRCLWSL
jgi:hypothetical protein